eukprot:2665862-Rhodomonas_salina.1
MSQAAIYPEVVQTQSRPFSPDVKPQMLGNLDPGNSVKTYRVVPHYNTFHIIPSDDQAQNLCEEPGTPRAGYIVCVPGYPVPNLSTVAGPVLANRLAKTG